MINELNFRNLLSFKYIIPIATVIWTIVLIFIEDTPGNVPVEIFIIFFSTAMTIIIGMDGVRIYYEEKGFRIIAALFNIIIGLALLVFGFSLIRISLILLIGGELFGISTTIRIRSRTTSSIPASTRRPSPIPSPEPEPQPEPL